jgi:5-methylcytosine-specific restriction protein A
MALPEPEERISGRNLWPLVQRQPSESLELPAQQPKVTLEQLKALAAKAKKKPTRRSAGGVVYDRNAAVVELAKRLADGLCDLCRSPAPFLNKKSVAYLECHHIIWLSKGGDDFLSNTVALCPNCHRKMHVLNKEGDIKSLITRAQQRDQTNGISI